MNVSWSEEGVGGEGAGGEEAGGGQDADAPQAASKCCCNVTGLTQSHQLMVSDGGDALTMG